VSEDETPPRDDTYDGVDAAGVVVALAFVVSALFCCGDCGPSESQDESSQTQKAEESEEPKDYRLGKAWNLCERMVEERVKAPSTLDLPNLAPTYDSQPSSNVFVVGLDFSAKNPMGVRLEKTAECTVTFKGQDIADAEIEIR
jgi:hypothetical protein